MPTFQLCIIPINLQPLLTSSLAPILDNYCISSSFPIGSLILFTQPTQIYSNLPKGMFKNFVSNDLWQSRIPIKCTKQMGKIINCYLNDRQFGFREYLRTKEVTFALSLLLGICRNQRKDVYICFIDYEKAFHIVEHTECFSTFFNIKG